MAELHVATLCTALLYRRVSSDDQAREGLSLDIQQARTREYALQHGWIIGGEYEDVLTGTRDDRPRYQALLAEVQRLSAAHQPVVVVVQWLDRFGRSVMERARSTEEFRALRVSIHSVMERGEVPELVSNILAAIAEEEVRRLSERQQEVRAYVRAHGWNYPGRPAWGYMRRAAMSEERRCGAPATVLVVDPFRAPHVRQVWQRAADGESVHALARWVQGLPDEVRDSRSMSHHTIRRMLRAPVYIARSTVGERDILARPKMRWPALIDDGMWGQAQGPRGVYRQRRAGRTHALLRDLIRCPNCGHPMVGLAPQPRQQPQYFCLARVRGAWAPDLHCYETATAPLIDALVLSQVRSIVCAVVAATPEQLESLATAWQTSKDGPRGGNITHRIRTLEARRVSLQESWSDSAIGFVDGVIGKTEYEECRRALARQTADVEAELEELRCQAPINVLPELTDVLQSAHEWSVSLDGTDVLARRAVVNACVEQVVPRRVRRGQYSVQITWAPLGQVLRTWCGPWERGLPLSTDDRVAFYHGARSGDSSGLTARIRQIRPSEEDLWDLPSSAWDALSERDRAIVRLYYGFDEDGWRSLDEVAAQFGLTRAKVMYVLKRSRMTLLTHSSVS